MFTFLNEWRACVSRPSISVMGKYYIFLCKKICITNYLAYSIVNKTIISGGEKYAQPKSSKTTTADRDFLDMCFEVNRICFDMPW